MCPEVELPPYLKSEFNDLSLSEVFISLSSCLFVCLPVLLLFFFCTDEISEVKNVSIGFVHKTIQKKGALFTYILVPFSDPGRLSIY